MMSETILVPDQSLAIVALPLLPVKNTVLLPFMFLPLSVGRPSSRAVVDAALNSEDKTLLIACQRDSANEQPGVSDLYSVGTRAVIKKMSRGPEGVELLVQGIDRVEILEAEQSEPFLKARSPSAAAAGRKRRPDRGSFIARHRLGPARPGTGPPEPAHRFRPDRPRRPANRCAWPICLLQCSGWMPPRSRRSWKPSASNRC